MSMNPPPHRRQTARGPAARALAPRAAGAICLLAGLAAASGCVYRIPIQQGNYLDPAAIAQIKPGMTHSQVRYLLGTPMVPGAFDAGRWDYDYYLKTRRLEKPTRGHVVVFFSDDLVARVESDVKNAPSVPLSPRGVTAPEPRGAGGY
jgi:outer membrane protein assembly factor BamE